MKLAIVSTVVALFCISGSAQSGQDIWTAIDDPVAGMSYYHQAVAGNSYLFVSVNDSSDVPMGLFRRAHDSPPSDWELLTVEGGPRGLSVAGPSDEHVLVSTREGKIWYSSDSGESWSDRTGGLPAGGFSDQVFVHDSGYTYVTVRRADPGYRVGVARSTNFGATWEFSEWCGDCVILGFFDIIADGAGLEHAWATYMTGFFETQVSATVDGSEWQWVQPPGPINFVFKGLILDRLIPDRFYMMLAGQIWWFDELNYTDETALPIPGGGNMSLTTPAWDPGTLYASGWNSLEAVGVYKSTEDPYLDWTPLSEGLPETTVPSPLNEYSKYAMTAVPNQPKLYLAAWGIGLYERDVTIDPATVVHGPLDTSTFHSSFSPNPTTGTINWRLEIDAPERIEIVITDVSGRQRFRGSPEWLQPGVHHLDSRVNPSLRTLPSGVYYLRLRRENGAVWSRRLSVIR